MKNEIFRFAVIRSPILTSHEKIDKKVNKILSLTNQPLPFYSRLKDQIVNQGSRIKISKEARTFLDQNGIDLEFSGLSTAINQFSNWLHLNVNDASLELINSIANQFFGKSIIALNDDDSFKRDTNKIVDASIAVSTLINDIDPLRSQLLKLVRTIHFLQSAKQRENGLKSLKEIFEYPILFPKDVFPLPLLYEERKKEIEKGNEKRKEYNKKRKEQINNLQEKLRKNEKAILELNSAYKSYNNKRRAEAETPNINPNAPLSAPKTIKRYDGIFQKAFRFLGVLPVEEYEELEEERIFNFSTKPVYLPTSSVNNLSLATKEVLKENQVDEGSIAVPNLISILENTNLNISNDLNASLGSYTTIDEEFGLFFDPDKIVFGFETPGSCATPTVNGPDFSNQGFVPDTYGKVHKIGVADLMIVRQNLIEYTTEEIAHIENVLEGEHKKRRHRRLEKEEEIVFKEVEREQEQELDLQTSNQFELQKETSETISSDRSIDAGVTITAKWGPVETTAYGNYASTKSEEVSRDTATSMAREIVSRSVRRIKERVLNRRTRTTLREVEETNIHSISNTPPGNGHITGIYKWVNKLYEAQVINYGKRIILEFIIPQPAAFYKYALSLTLEGDNSIEKPDAPGYCRNNIFTPLQPKDINENSYQFWVGKYGVRDISPPPAQYKKVSFSLTNQFQRIQALGSSKKDKSEHSLIQLNQDLTLPNDYRAVEANMEINGLFIGAWKADIIIGKKKLINRSGEKRLSTVLELEEGSIPFVLYTRNIITFGISIEIQCERKPELFTQWQIDTFNAIMSAYNELFSQYQEEIQANEVQEGIDIQGRNPVINREIEHTELKRLSLSQLTGQNYELFSSVSQANDPNYNYPEVDLTSNDAFEEGKYIQFFESALEWRLMTYLFYPYFWNDKANWAKNIQIEDNDPLFEKFLKAGAARVQVPIREGFENIVCEFVDAGVMVGERDENACVDNDNKSFFLSMIEEMKEQLDNDFVDRVGTISVTQGSNEVTGTGTDFRKDDENREILINLKTYRIAKFDSSTKIILREAYDGNDDSNIGVAIGVKLVGEPWVVEIPTNLVYLQKSQKLNGID